MVAMAAVACLSTASAQPTAGTQASALQVDIAAGPLASAVLEISRRYEINLVVSDALLKGKSAPAITGALSADQALDRALAGSGLTVRQNASGAFVIARAERSSTTARPASSSGQTDVQETLVVTGTRIERTASNAPSPVDIVTAEELTRLGLTDNTEALRFVPALQQSLSLTANNTISFGNFLDTGLASLDLRGLGPERTLVLVNGRRHVAGSPGTAIVDVGTIPAALLDRVEVLTGGGSSIYGADAVTGVVNYVLKDDFEGLAFSSNYGLPTQGSDGEAVFASLTLGGNFAKDRGNAVVSIEYNRQDNLPVADRDFLANRSGIASNNAALSEFLGVNPDFANVLIPDIRDAAVARDSNLALSLTGNTFDAIVAGGGTFGGFPAYQLFDRTTGELRAFDLGIQDASLFRFQGGDGVTVFNPNADGIPQTERVIVNALADYDIRPGVNAYVEAKYARSDITARGSFGVTSFNLPIGRDNAFLPDSLAAQFDDLATQGLDPSLVVNFSLGDPALVEPGEIDRETVRLVGGVRGDVSSGFAYDLSVNYGRTTTSATTNDEILLDRFFAAIDAVVDPATGNIVCRSTLDPEAPLTLAEEPFPINPGATTFDPASGACVPTNIFAPLTPEQAAFFGTSLTSNFEIDQLVVNATITGNSEDLFTLPAGAIGYAAGLEYRDESSRFEPDALELAGFGEFAAFGDIPEIVAGGFDVIEGFAEISVPVLSGQPLAQRLDLDASVRLADYSTVGSATSFAFGGIWQPVADLRVRASYNRAIRAPNIAELFSPQAADFAFVVGNQDPCFADNLDDGSEFRAGNCAQLTPQDFDPGLFATSPLTTGGNPDLDEERADTFTVGFVVTPTVAPGLTLIADYYDISIDNAIQLNPNRFAVINNCVDAPTIDNAACAAVPRDPVTGVIQSVQSTALNLSASSTRGIDYQFSYLFGLNRAPEAGLGTFRVDLAGNYLIEREETGFEGIPASFDVLRGEVGRLGTPAFPRHFLNASLSWSKGPWSADYGFTYQSSTTFGFFGIGAEEIDADPLLINVAETGDAFVHSVGGAYDVSEGLRLFVRVNNLTDREPFAVGGPNQRVRPTSFLGRTVQFGVQGRL